LRIVVDINHPAHVHYFKNFIWGMERRGHEVLITASEKDVSLTLLRNYGFDFINLGSYGKSISKKLLNILPMDLKMYKAVKAYTPDIFLGFGSIRASHVSKLMGKPCVALDDTEHAKWEHRLYVPFTDAILTPTCFKKDFGKKQIRYNGYTELAYLHPNYFKPDPSILDELGLSKGDTFILLRFVSWTANHDIGQKGIQNRINFVKELETYGRVLISAEGRLEKELEKYRVKIPPDKIHDVLYYATLYMGEGATMASEAAVLGTHAVYINTLPLGYLEEQESRYQLVFNFNKPNSEKRAFDKALELLENNDLWRIGKRKRKKLLKEKIDVTKFMITLIENFERKVG